jgi:hypothetical protein
MEAHSPGFLIQVYVQGWEEVFRKVGERFFKKMCFKVVHANWQKCLTIG